MELYISDHPLDCLTCAANGDCELQDMAGAVGLREVRYGYDGANHLDAPMVPKDKDESLFHLRSRRNASSARAACAPARKCRAPSR
jgi:formate dehydrogenase major subunit